MEQADPGSDTGPTGTASAVSQQGEGQPGRDQFSTSGLPRINGASYHQEQSSPVNLQQGEGIRPQLRVEPTGAETKAQEMRIRNKKTG